MLALQALRAAYNGIQYCCEALGEGRVEIQRIKKTVEGGVKDAKALYSEVTGLWGWLQKLLGLSKPKVSETQTVLSSTDAAQEPAVKPKAKSKKRDEYVEHIPTEDEIVQQYIGHLGDFFTNHGKLSEYTTAKYAEVFGKDVIDPKEVLELTTLQAEIDSAYLKLSELMRVRAPRQLGPLWDKFNAMNDKVKAGQAARQLKEKREKDKLLARLARERNDRIDRSMIFFWTLGIVWYCYMLLGLVWLNTKITQS